jgi:hypothetical protein
MEPHLQSLIMYFLYGAVQPYRNLLGWVWRA